MKRSILVLLSVVILLCLAFSAVMADSLHEEPGDLVIYFTNDTHGRVIPDLSIPAWGYSRIAKEKQNSLAVTDSVLLFSAGDEIQGEPIINLDQGSSAIDFMNATGYDAMTLGNHEFDYGSDVLEQLADKAQFPFLAANVTRQIGGENVFEPNKIFEEPNGMKVCVFGLATPETLTSSNPKNTKGLDLAAGEELYRSAQAQVDAFASQDCSLIVALGHLGINELSKPNRSTDVLQNVTGIDVFIDGHSHTVENEMVNDTLLVSTGCYGNNLGKLVFDGENMNAVIMPAYDEDETVAELINTKNAEIQEKLSEVFAQTEVLLNGQSNPGVRTMETNLGDYSADAILWAAQQIQPDVVAALTNGGGIRTSIEIGDITMNNMETVYPFGNTVVILSVPGKDILEAIEANCAVTPEPSGGFPQVSGMEYTIDTTVPFEQGELYPGTTRYAPAKPGSRVTITSIGGEPFDPEKTYKIATNDHVAAGGDSYCVFKYSNETSGLNTYVLLNEALVNYTYEVMDGVIDDTYAEPAGRITIK